MQKCSSEGPTWGQKRTGNTDDSRGGKLTAVMNEGPEEGTVRKTHDLATDQNNKAP